jgi:soluble lytic murein transglycosylase-like protein
MSVQDQITAAAQSAGVPPWLALNIAQRESDFDNNAVGSAGEIGIFQLLPTTAAQLGVDPTDPTQNIAGGVAFIAQLLRTFGGDVQKAAAAFNCGAQCVANAVAAGGQNWAAHIPSSTQAYVVGVVGSLPTVSSAAPQYAAAPPATTPPAVLVPGSPIPGTLAPAFNWESWAWAGAGLLGFLALYAIGQAD